MPCGLYGKLPQKRDFIAVATPREFLSVWERWLQGGISASRMTLASTWQNEFLRAPLWRFWLGRGVVGRPTIGVVMPSVDGVGRYFPLTIFAQAEAGSDLPPPEFETYEPWFERAEGLLLSALDEGGSFDAVSAALAGLADPIPGTTAALRRADVKAAPDGSTVAELDPGQPLGPQFASLRAHDHGRAYANQTCWWTAGGEGYAPRILVGSGMPDPHLFTGILTGRFAEAS